MNPAAAQKYLRAKVLTATPEQLQMMLFDGALRFGEQARAALAAKKYDESYEGITKVQKIVMELRIGLRPDVYPELCNRLAGIYTYVYKRLIAANVDRDLPALEEATKLLKFQRDTWALLMEKLSKDKAAVAAIGIDMPEPSDRMEASISMQG